MDEAWIEITRRLIPPGFESQFGSLVRAGPVVLAADPGALERGMIESAARQATLEPIFIDARLAGNRHGLVVDTTRAIVERVARNTRVELHHTAIAEEDRLPLAEAFGGQVNEAVAAAMGLANDDWTLETALQGVPDRFLCVIAHAHLLSQKWAQRALWTFRGHAAERGLRIVFTTRPWHAEALVGPEAAFFGFAEQFQLSATIEPELADALAASDPEFPSLLRQTERQRAATAEVLAARAPRTGLEATYERLVSARMPTAQALITLAQRITPLGGRLVSAVARGEAPYRAATRAVPARVASGLTALRDVDVIYSPRPRQWAMADPLTGDAVRRL